MVLLNIYAKFKHRQLVVGGPANLPIYQELTEEHKVDLRRMSFEMSQAWRAASEREHALVHKVIEIVSSQYRDKSEHNPSLPSDSGNTISR